VRKRYRSAQGGYVRWYGAFHGGGQ
jgi:hypothetical protein